MSHSFKSLLLSLIVWILLILCLTYSKQKITKQPQTFSEINAFLIGEDELENRSRNRSGQEMVRSKNETESDYHHVAEGENHAEKNKGVVASEFAIKPIFQPLPNIPDELRERAFHSDAIVRFHIAADGSVTKVELIKPSFNNRLDEMLLRSLRRWKFSAASSGEVKVSIQDIRVRFLVE